MLEDGGIEEERRLMYVAITRARKRLYLSYAGSRMLHGSRATASFRASSRRSRRALQVDRASGRHAPVGPRAEVGSVIGDNPGARAADARPQADPDRYRVHGQPRAFRDAAPGRAPFAVGQNVRHDKFGEGVVIDFEGAGSTRACRCASRARARNGWPSSTRRLTAA
jgi:DNA helicase-2/ATP-dependent DNA helicase PcrA